MTTEAAPRSGRLSADDWAREALDQIVEQGVASVAVEPLARRLGVTKGSFYWHFPSRDALLQAALERWERDEQTAYGALEAIDDATERLRTLFRLIAHHNKTHIISNSMKTKQDSKGRTAVVEIMLNSPLISDLIFKGEVGEIKEIMKKSRELGMQTFDQALFDAFEANLISYEDAIRNADSMNDLRLQIKLTSKRAKDRDLAAGTEHLQIV